MATRLDRKASVTSKRLPGVEMVDARGVTLNQRSNTTNVQRRRQSHNMIALKQTGRALCCLCHAPSCCSKPKTHEQEHNELGMSLTATISIIRSKVWHNYHQVLTMLALFVTVVVHLVEVLFISIKADTVGARTKGTVITQLYLTNLAQGNTTTPLSNMTECEFFDFTHHTNHNSSLTTAEIYGEVGAGEIIIQILSWFAFTVLVVSGASMFGKHNFDVALVAPIVKTPEVILLIWAGFAMVVLETWLLATNVQRMFTYAYKLTVLIELILVVFMDSLVRLWHGFQLFHTITLVFLLGLDMLMTIAFSRIDTRILCLGMNDSVVVSSFMVQRVLFINMLTALGPSLIVLCKNKKRTQMRFAVIPVERMAHASLLTEGATGEEANDILKVMILKNVMLAERVKHVQKTLFNHEFGGSSTTLSLQQSSANRTDETISSSRISVHSQSSFDSGARTVLEDDAVPAGCEDGVGAF